MKEKISIIIPIYNAEHFLKQCIESILNQTYRELEVILINDGSTDHSLQICRYYEHLDSRIIIINQPNRGVSCARNAGLTQATGAWISFLDADDWLDTGALEWAIHTQQCYNTDIVLWNRIDEFQTKSVPRFYADNKLIISDIKEYENFKFRIFTGHSPEGKRDYGPQNIYAKIIRKKVLNNIRFDESLKHHEDIFFMLEVYEQAKSLYLENQLFYHRRIHTNSAIHKFCPEIAQNNKLISYKYLHFLKKNNKSVKYYNFWKGLHVHWLTQIFSLYVFHPYNKMYFKVKLNYVHILLDSDPYKNVFKDTPHDIILPKKIFFEIARRKLVVLLLLYTKLYNSLRPNLL